MLWAKKNSYKEFDNEKNFVRLENSSPPCSQPENMAMTVMNKATTQESSVEFSS